MSEQKNEVCRGCGTESEKHLPGCPTNACAGLPDPAAEIARLRAIEAENARLLLLLTRVTAACSQLLDALQGPGDPPRQSEVDERSWNAMRIIREVGAVTKRATKVEKPKVPPFRFSESDEPLVGDPVKANNRRNRTPKLVNEWREWCHIECTGTSGVSYCAVTSPSRRHLLTKSLAWRDANDTMNAIDYIFGSVEHARAALAACMTPPPGVAP